MEGAKIIKTVTPDDIIAAMFSFFKKNEISIEDQKVHLAIYEIKKKYPEMLKEFSFSENDFYPFSRLLEKVLFRLVNSTLIRPIAPDFKMAIVDDVSKRYIRKNILPLFEKKHQRKLSKMGRLFEQLLST